MSLIKRTALVFIGLTLSIVGLVFPVLAQKQVSTIKTVKGTDIHFTIKVPGTFRIISEQNLKDNLYLDFTFENADESSYFLEGSSMVMRFKEEITQEEYLKAVDSFVLGFKKAFKGKDSTPQNSKPLSFGGHMFNMRVIQEPPASEADCETNHYFLFSYQNNKIIMFRFSTAAEEEDEAITAMNTIMKSFKLTNRSN